MHVTRLRYLIRRVLGVALLGTLCSHSVVAQSETKVHLKTINALISTWASLELFLLDAPSLSDSQRGTVEVFEEALRKELFATAAPIRDANAGCANRWPFPHDAVDSAIDRMSQVRERRFDQARSFMTPDQQRVFDRNRERLAAVQATLENFGNEFDLMRFGCGSRF